MDKHSDISKSLSLQVTLADFTTCCENLTGDQTESSVKPGVVLNYTSSICISPSYSSIAAGSTDSISATD